MVSVLQIIFVGSEAVRKYLLNELMLLTLLDIAILFLLIAYSSNRQKKWFLIISATLLCHTLVFSLGNNYPQTVFLAGIRPVVFAFAGIVLAKYHFERTSTVTLATLGLSAYAMASFALLQIFLGKEHPVNHTPMVLELSRGFGGYSYAVRSALSDVFPVMFRPATVFITTGKFGTYVASLSLIVVSLLLATKHKLPTWSIFILLAGLILVNLVAMQRAFWYPFAASSIVFFLFFRLSITHLMATLFFCLTLFSMLSIQYYELLLVIIDRLSQFPSEIIGRISEFQRILPMSLENVLFGKGFGFFSNYSHIVGGSNYMDYYWNTGEGQYHILIAEFGALTTAVAVTLATIFAIHQMTKAIICRGAPSDKIYFLRSVITILILVWGTTHTIFASVFLVMSFSFSLAILSLELDRLKAQPTDTGL